MFKVHNIWRLITVAALLAGALNLSLVPATPVQALSSDIVISQVYGGGGNTGATYKNDYIELFNLGTTTVSIDGWSVQYASATGSAWAKTDLTGTIQAGQYYLVQEAAGSGGTTSLPTPDATGSLAMAGTNGKVALVSSGTLLTGTCPSGAVDMVGFGSANCYETTATPVLTNITAAKRNTNGCTETDDNSTDFTVANPTVAPTPRNTASPLSPCGPVLPNLTIDDVSLAEGDSSTSNFTFTVSLSATSASDVTFDIATADGTATAGSDYVSNSTTGTILAGSTSTTFDVTVNGDTTSEVNETFTVDIANLTGANLGDGQGLGTILNDDVVLPELTINNVTVVEGNSSTTTASFTVTLAPASASDVTFDIATADNTATIADNDYVNNSLTGQTITAGNTSYTFDVAVNGDLIGESDETFYVNLDNVSAGVYLTDGQGLGTITNDDVVITPTYTIQGSGSATTIPGTYTTEGVVVGDYEGGVSPQIRGFYIQDATGDGNVATSDGLFVYNGSNDSVALGDLVRVTGTVSDYQGQTQISATTIVVLSSGNTITPTDISLPFASAAVEEQYEGMLVRVPQTLYVTEIYQLGRFGQITMSGTGKLYQPTNIVAPGAPALAMQATNDLNKIVVDDALNTEDPDPILFGRSGNPLSASNTLRGGDTIANLVGVFTYTWGGNSASPNAYRIRPVNAMGGGIPNFVATNARPSTPPVVGGSVKAVGMNLLNYFNTFDDGNAGTPGCFPSGNDSDCRGANDATEFTRQSDKTVNAILALNADVIGIVEIENDGYDSASAIQDLVTKLNTVAGAGTYAFINPDTANGANSLGVDAIKVGILYKPAVLTPVGNTVTLNTVAFINGGDSAPRNRASLLQTFQTVTGERFLLNVNHLKSKGSACTVPDAGDGQGNCNVVRTNAVNELIAWYATDPTGTGDPDILIVGDLNSYAKEDPIKAFETAGYTNMVNHFGGAEAYSYVFDGQWGYLDYAIGSSSLLAQASGVADWHINSDEPSVLDYNTDFKTAGQIVSLYSSDPFRISDHDPVITGLNLDSGIVKIPLTVTASSSSITYGATPVVTPNYSGFTGGDDASVLDTAPTCTAGAGPFTVAGSPYITSCSGGLDNKYSFTYVNGSLTVNKATLTVTANNQSIFTTQPDPIFTFAYAGFVNSETSTVVDTAPTCGVTGAHTAIGTYPIVCSNGLDNNYAFSYVNGTLTVKGSTFSDVPMDHWAWQFVESLYASGITSGCGTGPLIYCPSTEDTRDQMAVFLLRGIHGAAYVPPAVGVSTGFNDVPTTHWAAAWIKQLAVERITTGCGNSNFCPSSAVTRDQMSVFLLRAEHGASYIPPAVDTGTGFNDVLNDQWAAAWIKQLALEGVTSGCGNSNFCPGTAVTRDQMAVFLVKIFNLP